MARCIGYMTTCGKKLKRFLELIERNLTGLRLHVVLDRRGARRYCHVAVIQI